MFACGGFTSADLAEVEVIHLPSLEESNSNP